MAGGLSKKGFLLPRESLLPEDLIIIAYNAWSKEAVNFLHKPQLSYCCGAKLCVANVSQRSGLLSRCREGLACIFLLCLRSKQNVINICSRNVLKDDIVLKASSTLGAEDAVRDEKPVLLNISITEKY